MCIVYITDVQSHFGKIIITFLYLKLIGLFNASLIITIISFTRFYLVIV